MTVKLLIFPYTCKSYAQSVDNRDQFWEDNSVQLQTATEASDYPQADRDGDEGMVLTHFKMLQQ